MAMTPVIVGVADVKNRNIQNAKEPADLMLEAVSLAFQDSHLSPPDLKKLTSDIDSIDVVRTWTWSYRDLPGLLATRLGVSPKHSHYSEHGGHQPAKILDDTALRIASGQSKVAVITGGEALASRRLTRMCMSPIFADLESAEVATCAKAGKMPPPGWTEPENPVTEVFTPTNLELEKGT